MIAMFYLALSINGLDFVTVAPFNSEEACILAAKTVGAEKDQYTCIKREFPAPYDQSH
jgi:hypothetical protein